MRVGDDIEDASDQGNHKARAWKQGVEGTVYSTLEQKFDLLNEGDQEQAGKEGLGESLFVEAGGEGRHDGVNDVKI